MKTFTSGFIMLALVVACASGTTNSLETSTTVPTTTTPNTTAVPPTTPSVSTTTSAGTTSTADDRDEAPRIKVEDGVKTEGLGTLSVRVGETVRFEVEADVADEVHVHGYDLHFETVPDEEVLIEFEATAAGIFEVELEAAGLPLLDLEVTP